MLALCSLELCGFLYLMMRRAPRATLDRSTASSDVYKGQGGGGGVVFFLMIRRPPRSTLDRSSAASDVYKRQVQHGVVRTAANIDKKWIDSPGQWLFSETLGRRCLLVNDADAAGVAELRYGAARGHDLSLIHISEPTRPY